MIYGLCLDTLKELKMTAWLCSVSPSLDDADVCKLSRFPLQQEEQSLLDSPTLGSARQRLVMYKCEDCDEAFALCFLFCVCVWRSKRAATCLATIAGSYTSAYLAGDGA